MNARSRLVRRGTVIAVSAVVLASAPAPFALAAQRTLVTVLCTGQSVSNYSPPLTDTAVPTTITAHGALGGEANPGICLGVGAVVVSAHYDEKFTNPSQSCNTPPSTQSGTRVYIWDNGETSSFSYTTHLTVINGTSASVRTGTITAGRFAGQNAEQITAFPTLDVTACANGGVAQASSQTTLTIGL